MAKRFDGQEGILQGQRTGLMGVWSTGPTLVTQHRKKYEDFPQLLSFVHVPLRDSLLPASASRSP